MSYSADSPMLAPHTAGTAMQCSQFILARPHGAYTVRDITNTIIPAYFSVCVAVGVEPVMVIAQMIHETGCLTSALSQRSDKDRRPLRNPAGIGVDGRSSSTPLPGYVWDADRKCYRACCGFTSWTDGSIPAHVGRVLRYALKPGQGNLVQQNLMNQALAVRALPKRYWGCAPTLAGFDGTWATPGRGYGRKLANVANSILGLPIAENGTS